MELKLTGLAELVECSLAAESAEVDWQSESADFAESVVRSEFAMNESASVVRTKAGIVTVRRQNSIVLSWTRASEFAFQVSGSEPAESQAVNDG